MSRTTSKSLLIHAATLEEPPAEMNVVRLMRDADIRVLTELQGATCSNTIFQMHPDVHIQSVFL